MDADGDGGVSSREFAKDEALGVALSSRDSAALFEALDADGSGSLAPLELEVLLLGRRLDDERRAALSPTRTATPATVPTEAPAAATTTAAAPRWAVCSACCRSTSSVASARERRERA